jgi:C1A family cysteine protease
MKTIAILALVGLAATAFFAMSGPSASNETEFRNFLETHRVGYGTTEEYNYRLGVFQANLKRIEELNQANPQATFAVNQFADRTPEEMAKLMTLNVPASRLNTNARHITAADAKPVDWTNMWSAVKDQGQCGSCWAFSATAAFEARYALNGGSKTVSTLFSEQELVDCDPKSNGCNGGFMDNAFEYLETHGFCTEDQYPYTARDGTCQADKCSSGPQDKAFTDIPAKNEAALLNELVNGPVSVAVDASTWSFYSGGIMSSCGTGLNHGVTLVATDGQTYAKIRNSWGGSWGEKGHIRIALNKDTCGYADVASYPTF